MCGQQLIKAGASIVTQWVEWSLSTPEICSLNPVIGKFYLHSIVNKL